MSEDREQLNDRYLEAQLREELGIDPDLSENVLHAVYGKPRRVIPGPRKPARWRPLAAAAVVLVAAGAATYALFQILPNELSRPNQRPNQTVRQEHPGPPAKPQQKPDTDQPAPEEPQQPVPDEPRILPQPEPEPTELPLEPAPKTETKVPGDLVDTPKPDNPPWTDPPDSWPGPKQPPKPDDSVEDGEVPHPNKKGVIYPPHPGGGPEPKYGAGRKELPVLVGSWKSDGLKVRLAGKVEFEHVDQDFEIRAGDTIKPKTHADFNLVDGSLVRIDGELTIAGSADALELALHDGVLYADTRAPLSVTCGEARAKIDGVSVLEQRLHGMDVFCVAGTVQSNGDTLSAGIYSRLEADGFGRDKAITWADVQREFRFLKDTPSRSTLVEELSEAPGELFGGKIVDGVLVGKADGETGLGFYLRAPYTFSAGDVVRFRFRVAKACEMILQFGTVGDGNWRHKMGGVKAGEWIEYEVPLIELYKTTDVARKAAPGLALKFFQLHPEDNKAHIELDRVEIVHRP